MESKVYRFIFKYTATLQMDQVLNVYITATGGRQVQYYNYKGWMRQGGYLLTQAKGMVRFVNDPIFSHQ